MPRDVRSLMFDGGSYFSIIGIIKEYHHSVADHFYKGLGVTLMRKVSDVLIELLLELKTQNIVALPIHDEVLVAEHDHEQAIVTMETVLEEYVGVPVTVNIED